MQVEQAKASLKWVFPLMAFMTLAGQTFRVSAQSEFRRVNKREGRFTFYDVKPDKQGIIWIAGYERATNQPALIKYDGDNFTPFGNDPKDPRSLPKNYPTCLQVDDDNCIWMGTNGSGLVTFDPSRNSFSRIRHTHADTSGLSNDTVIAIAKDNEGILWIGTANGLNRLDTKTGNFTHYFSRPGDSSALPDNYIRYLYVDHQNVLWAASGRSALTYPGNTINIGGLARFNRKTDNFTCFLHKDNDSHTLQNNKVSCVFEDSKGKFWVATLGDGLYIMDRHTGICTQYPRDPDHPQVLSRPPLSGFANDGVTFINEDSQGIIWIGSALDGMNRYDPTTKITTHVGDVLVKFGAQTLGKDTVLNFSDFSAAKSCNTPDGTMWVMSAMGNLYSSNPPSSGIKFEFLKANANAFYQEDNNIRWIGTNKGLWRTDGRTGTTTAYLSNDTITAMQFDGKGSLWISTIGRGMCRFDLKTYEVLSFRHDPQNTNSLSSDSARNLLIDYAGNIWIGTWGEGLDKMDAITRHFTHFRHDAVDTTSLSNDNVDGLYEQKDHTLWVGSYSALEKVDPKHGGFRHYLKGDAFFSLYADSAGVLWAGGVKGLFRYDRNTDVFSPYVHPATGIPLGAVTGILEDGSRHLWLRTQTSLIRIDRARTAVQVYGELFGVRSNQIWICRCLKVSGDNLLFGGLDGYYNIPTSLIKEWVPMTIAVTYFALTGKDEDSLPPTVFSEPLYRATEATLDHNQHSFTVRFTGIHYSSPGELRYSALLENYDHSWQDLGTEGKVSFYGVPPGHYILHLKCLNTDLSVYAEKNMNIVIYPPWWQTWWAYTFFGFLFIVVLWSFINVRGNRLIVRNKQLEEKVQERTEQLQQSLEELKATQRQLIQSEKMASLGELTAGIAHEIQNPLNFVNNFSEINTELIGEMNTELLKGNYSEALIIAQDIRDNEEKITVHGKRADGIVKGMLLHSRTNSGQKDPTDINALVDEYLRLSYHGLRAKDKLFNVTMVTEFDPVAGQINVVPQDIGRVLVNLFTNAFYSVSEKKKMGTGPAYDPTIWVKTQHRGTQIDIRIKDNGLGIPRKVIDKIFQPFFTTKPSGKGTGLGLSLSYDVIVKGHGGELIVDTSEGQFAEFIIRLPAGTSR